MRCEWWPGSYLHNTLRYLLRYHTVVDSTCRAYRTLELGSGSFSYSSLESLACTCMCSTVQCSTSRFPVTHSLCTYLVYCIFFFIWSGLVWFCRGEAMRRCVGWYTITVAWLIWSGWWVWHTDWLSVQLSVLNDTMSRVFWSLDIMYSECGKNINLFISLSVLLACFICLFFFFFPDRCVK